MLHLLAASLVGPQGAVIAVEPNPGNIAQLRHNLTLNHLDNVRVVESALGAEDGKEVALEGEGVACTVGPSTSSANVTSTTATLGKVVEQFGPKQIQTLKIDVEGAETEMFRCNSDINVIITTKFVVVYIH